jgi:hypothetical protein
MAAGVEDVRGSIGIYNRAVLKRKPISDRYWATSALLVSC